MIIIISRLCEWWLFLTTVFYQATSMLEKSLAQDETYTDAVCLLAEIMGKKQEYDKAIAL